MTKPRIRDSEEDRKKVIETLISRGYIAVQPSGRYDVCWLTPYGKVTQDSRDLVFEITEVVEITENEKP